MNEINPNPVPVVDDKERVDESRNVVKYMLFLFQQNILETAHIKF